eukprot:2940346-Amphidinium_carterae.1
MEPLESYWGRAWKLDTSTLDVEPVFRFQSGREFVDDVTDRGEAGWHEMTCFRRSEEGDPPEREDPMASFYLICTITFLACIPICYVVSLDRRIERAVENRCLRAIGIKTEGHEHESAGAILMTASRRFMTKSKFLTKAGTFFSHNSTKTQV